jgi:hypothetical protein
MRTTKDRRHAPSRIAALLASVTLVACLLSGCGNNGGSGFSAAEKRALTQKPDPNNPPQAMKDFMAKANQSGGPPKGPTKSPWSK